MPRVRTTRSTIREYYSRRRKCAAMTPECSRTQQGQAGLPRASLAVRRVRNRLIEPEAPA